MSPAEIALWYIFAILSREKAKAHESMLGGDGLREERHRNQAPLAQRLYETEQVTSSRICPSGGKTFGGLGDAVGYSLAINCRIANRRVGSIIGTIGEVRPAHPCRRENMLANICIIVLPGEQLDHPAEDNMAEIAIDLLGTGFEGRGSLPVQCKHVRMRLGICPDRLFVGAEYVDISRARHMR